MSEKIYAWLLRLYPPHFRENYGDEALQLLRDRARDETGFFRTLRLWLDLLTDLVISIPREYRSVRPSLGAAVQRVGGGPTFFVRYVCEGSFSVEFCRWPCWRWFLACSSMPEASGQCVPLPTAS